MAHRKLSSDHDLPDPDVVVVAHEHISEYINAEALGHVAERIQKQSPVIATKENIPPLVAAGQHVIQRPLKLYPPCACHDG